MRLPSKQNLKMLKLSSGTSNDREPEYPGTGYKVLQRFRVEKKQ